MPSSNISCYVLYPVIYMASETLQISQIWYGREYEKIGGGLGVPALTLW